ncbi:Bgt-1218 [Blumeria graminis f. sp. tritici]|uniref:Bgt-1218 n=2 Tax=Blumeria graminis f. sp. tritici TaxID=62690 RepID=A0A9X9PR52_BLUGR|nr:Bgt-1218 [Blumeria graminis f. sp. tritici]
MVGTQNHSETVSWEICGDLSGVDVLQHIREYVNDVLSVYNITISSDSCPDMSSSDSSSILFARPGDNLSCLGDLPPFETAKEVCEAAFGETSILYRFIDTPAFYLMLAELYTLPGDNPMGRNNEFINLLFSILALGIYVQNKRHSKRNRSGDGMSETRIDQGRKYFSCARSAIDISDCGTIPQLQTILFLILYLQSTADLDVCYSYI